MARDRFIDEEAFELTEQQKALATNVRGQMNDWIDESVNRLTRNMSEVITETGEKLSEQVTQVAEEFEAAGKKMDELLKTIDALASDLEAGDGATIADAVTKTRDQVMAVRAELMKREDRWQNLGKGIVNTGLKAASTIVKIPFLS